ncbi:MAG: YgiT-type zinc finger protein [Chloroflexota bacterium]
MSIDNPVEDQPHFCPACQIGVLQITQVTYFTFITGEMITVPDFPAWDCDICNYQEVDARALSRLHVLLDPNTARPAHQTKPPGPPAEDAPTAAISK